MKNSKKTSPKFAPSRLRVSLLRFHKDDRGAISVLVLLTIWCLVAIIGLLWNTTEEARRRQQVQTAADSAAHASATWMARSVNAIAAQNMVICQDASAEIIWRAVPPTDRALVNELTGEIALAEQMKRNQALSNMLRQFEAQLTTIANEYQLTGDALAYLQSGAGANYANIQESITYTNHIRQARSAMNWTYNTYVNGAPAPPGSPGPPPAPQRPGPPGPNGEGLAQLIAKWKPPATQTAILDYIENYINTVEMPIALAFEARTAPATLQPVDALMAQHEAEVYQNELAQAALVAGTIEAQRSQLAAFYKTDITLATLKNDSAGSARVAAPLMPAVDALPVTEYTDSIRAAYPVEAAEAGLSPTITIDPINPHTLGARIWHPDLAATVPADLRAQFPTLALSYKVTGSPADGWGHLWAMPLEHYLDNRANGDLQELDQAYMVPLDQSRTGPLAQQIRRMLGIPETGNLIIADLPGSIPDDQPRPYIPPIVPPGTPVPPPPATLPVIYDPVPVLPRLSAPPNASAAYRTQVDLYNQHGAAFTGAVRGLRTSLITYTQYFNRFIQGFAQSAWHINVHNAYLLVAQNLGTGKQFMILSTYALRPIPDWAKPGMFDSASIIIENEIVSLNMQDAERAIIRSLTQSDPRGIGSTYLDATYRQAMLYAGYIGQAAQIADALIRPIAHQMALTIAAEWIRRPWAYEITPPELPVLPSRGVIPQDRQHEFSLLAAARQTEATAPRLLLPAIFSSDATQLAAYAQAETFNWMEFNADYGASERFDQVVFVPELITYDANAAYQNFIANPRGWRTGSIAGWNWRARLSLSDALDAALQNNPEFRQYLQDTGISNPDSGALDAINLH